MNREIKFRIWDKISGQFVTDETEIFLDKGELCFVNIEDEFEGVIQQFTGLKDKNDREIYEGDLLNVIIIRWSKDLENKAYVKEVKWIGAGFNISPINEMFTYEVVGNIFENPTLLEPKDSMNP